MNSFIQNLNFQNFYIPIFMAVKWKIHCTFYSHHIFDTLALLSVFPVLLFLINKAQFFIPFILSAFEDHKQIIYDLLSCFVIEVFWLLLHFPFSYFSFHLNHLNYPTVFESFSFHNHILISFFLWGENIHSNSNIHEAMNDFFHLILLIYDWTLTRAFRLFRMFISYQIWHTSL